MAVGLAWVGVASVMAVGALAAEPLPAGDPAASQSPATESASSAEDPTAPESPPPEASPSAEDPSFRNTPASSAADPPRREGALDEAVLALQLLQVNGTRPSGHASLGHYQRTWGAVDLLVERFVGDFGGGMRVVIAPLLREDAQRELVFARMEGSAGGRVGSWGGPLPGALALLGTVGFDGGEQVWFHRDVVARLYAMARVKGRVWLDPHLPVQVDYGFIPAMLGSRGYAVQEHRLRIATGYRYFGGGVQMTFATHSHTDRPHDYTHREIGVWLGMAVFE